MVGGCEEGLGMGRTREIAFCKKRAAGQGLPLLMVGAGGFEPPTSRTRTVRSSRSEPRPERLAELYQKERRGSVASGQSSVVSGRVFLTTVHSPLTTFH